jgi:hypothetical protein
LERQANLLRKRIYWHCVAPDESNRGILGRIPVEERGELSMKRSEREKIEMGVLYPICKEMGINILKTEKYGMDMYELQGMVIAEYRRVRSLLKCAEDKNRRLAKALELATQTTLFDFIELARKK